MRHKNKFLIIFFFYLMCILINAQKDVPNRNMWVTNGPINYLVVDGDYTYIAGFFTFVGPNTGHGGKLTTANTSPDNSFPRVNGKIYTCISDGNGGWYIGGDFTKVGTYARNRIARINSNGKVDASWNPNANSTVRSLAISGNYIYVGGDFTSISEKTINFIAKLGKEFGIPETSWHPNPDNKVYSLVISGSDIYAWVFLSLLVGSKDTS